MELAVAVYRSHHEPNGTIMNTETFREWLRERGCTFEQHERGRGEGHVTVTVRCEGRRAELPAAGATEDLDPATVDEVVEALGLDAAELPGPQSRV